MNKPPCTSLRRPAAERCRGFSLAELMVTLAVVATLSSLAIAAWSGIATSMKLTAMSNTFLSQLHLARTEAIKRNTRVAMCKSPDGILCVNTGGWEQGVLVFQDTNDNGVRDANETIIYRVAALPAGFRLFGNMNVSRYVSFAGTGGTLMTSGAFQAGTLTLCKLSMEAVEAREIIINSIGRPRIRKTTVSSCA